MAQSGLVRGLPRVEHADELCEACLAGKQRRLPFPLKARFRAAKPLELVHGDLCGSVSPPTPGGRRYVLLLIDDWSRYMWVELLKTKDEAVRAIVKFQAAAGGVRPQALCHAHGSRRVHGEAVLTAVFILNRSFTRSIDGVMPYEAWHNTKPDVRFLRVFGCVGHVKNVRPHLQKLDDRSVPMVFLGYDVGSKAYRMYYSSTKRLHISRRRVRRGGTLAQEAPGEPPTSSSFTVEYPSYVDRSTTGKKGAAGGHGTVSPMMGSGQSPHVRSTLIAASPSSTTLQNQGGDTVTQGVPERRPSLLGSRVPQLEEERADDDEELHLDVGEEPSTFADAERKDH
ncbi:hypothetical protein QYE76_002090 [Lolium multiflorum]|uniref:Retroviral polymerase SH3-like domain-containing protein n=1 Tax=Lolium multiflorum TaxID=4521 RepID=A0AAD8RMY6_LOLMU|nr:hypothetical protein QYE76_002090 [Lolium multiflorum]